MDALRGKGSKECVGRNVGGKIYENLKQSHDTIRGTQIGITDQEGESRKKKHISSTKKQMFDG